MATEVDKILVRIETDLAGLKRGLDQARRQVDGTTNNMSKSFGGIKTAIAAVGAALATLGIGVLATNTIRASAEMEDLEKAMASVFGGIKQGKSAVKFIQEFATKTPFDIQTLSRSFIQLGGAGIRPTEKLLTTLGNASSVSVNKLQTFEALTNILTKGLRGGLGLEELQTLVNAGIDVFGIFEEQLNLTRTQVSEFGQNAAGSAKLIDALLKGLDARFPDAMADASNNLSTSLSNLGISANNSLIAIGEGGFSTAVRDAANATSRLLESMRPLFTLIGRTLGAAVNGAVRGFQLLGQNINVLVGIGTLLAPLLALKLIPAFILLGKTLSTVGVVLARHPVIMLFTLLLAGAATVDGFSEKLETLGTTVTEKLMPALEGLGLSTEGLFTDFKDLELSQKDLANIMATAGTKASVDYTDKLKDLGDELQVVRAQTRGMNEELASMIQSAGFDPTKYISDDGSMMFNDSDKDADAVEKLVRDFNKLAKVRETLATIQRGEDYANERTELENLRHTVGDVEQAYHSGRISLEKYNDAIDRLNKEIAIAKGPLGELRYELDDLNKAYEQVAADGLRGLEDAMVDVFDDIVNGTANAEEAFRNLAGSIVRDLQKIQIRKTITEPLSEMLTNFTRGGSSGGNILSMLGLGGGGGGGGGGNMFGAISTGIKSLFGFAGGGAVQPNTPVMVGERGPEMFVPHSAGVVKNNQMSGGSSKPSIIINQSFNITGGAQQVARAEILAAAPKIREETLAAVREIQLRG